MYEMIRLASTCGGTSAYGGLFCTLKGDEQADYPARLSGLCP